MGYNYNKVIGANIRYKRKQNKMTVKELSEKFSFSAEFMRLIERGVRGVYLVKLCQLCEFFDITLDELVFTDLEKGIELREITPKKKEVLKLVKSMDENEIEFVIPILMSIIKMQKYY